ncbi:MAG: efflux RND transporter periplasmic adaptor subunit [Anaerolineae bacterium]|nr:efflux RND transporter periplasmic adaptor subunit [Anaerolineae bacterium]
MKRLHIVLVAVLALIISGCGGGAEETVSAPIDADYVPVVSVTGKVVPAVWATISSQAGGMVVELLVEPGSAVTADTVVVRLDPIDALLAVQQAEAAVAAAQAQLALLQAGARPEEIAAAEAQVAAAEAALAQANAQRDQLYSGATQAEIAAAEAALAAAQAEQLRARTAHDQTMECYELPDGSEVCPGLGPLEEQARYALHAADEAVAAAEAHLAALRAGVSSQSRSSEAGVAAAEAQRDIALAQLDLLQAAATDEQLAAAEAAVAQAAATLDAAHVALERCQVRVPFDGTIGVVHVRVGEIVAPGQPLVTLGNLATLRVETTDLDEIDVARVSVDQPVALTFDALPERTFSGRVTRISPMAEPGTGGVHYTAVIDIDDLAPEIRWGMTAFADIEVEQ